MYKYHTTQRWNVCYKGPRQSTSIGPYLVSIKTLSVVCDGNFLSTACTSGIDRHQYFCTCLSHDFISIRHCWQYYYNFWGLLMHLCYLLWRTKTNRWVQLHIRISLCTQHFGDLCPWILSRCNHCFVELMPAYGTSLHESIMPTAGE